MTIATELYPSVFFSLLYIPLRSMTLRIWSIGLCACAMLFALGMAPLPVSAQDSEEPEADDPIYRVETTGGTVYIGPLIEETDEHVVIRVDDGTEVRVQRDRIKALEKLDLDRVRNGAYWFKNPQSTRYFFAPNAIGLEEGRGYYQNTWVLFNNINYGLSDRFSVGVGFVPTVLFGVPVVPVWVLPKASFSNQDEDLHLAVGGVLGGVFGGGESTGLGLIYTATTVGGHDQNLTAGIGYGYAEGSFSQAPLFNVSGVTRVSQRFYLLTENYFFVTDDETTGIISAGIRYAPEGFSVDFGLFRPLEDTGGFIGLPWLGVSIPFGR